MRFLEFDWLVWSEMLGTTMLVSLVMVVFTRLVTRIVKLFGAVVFPARWSNVLAILTFFFMSIASVYVVGDSVGITVDQISGSMWYVFGGSIFWVLKDFIAQPMSAVVLAVNKKIKNGDEIWPPDSRWRGTITDIQFMHVELAPSELVPPPGPYPPTRIDVPMTELLFSTLFVIDASKVREYLQQRGVFDEVTVTG